MIKYRDGYKFQLAEDLTYSSPLLPDVIASTQWIALADRILTIRNGYSWDGASGPVFQTKSLIRASCIHDALYQLTRLGLISHECRADLDLIYQRVCLEDGMFHFRAQCHYDALRKFGDDAALAESEPKVLTAP
jgi:hypothetical protein